MALVTSQWPPPEIATYRAVERTPFERSVKRSPDAPTAPSRDLVAAMTPPPGVPIEWCRCGVSIHLDRLFHPRTNAERKYLDDWRVMHTGLGHRLVRDLYRAACRPYVTGCRNCGSPVEGRKQFYCTDGCRESFERDHFWQTARAAAIERQSIYAVNSRGVFRGKPYHALIATYCARCGERIEGMPEVNHIVPVNGARPFFGCMHHLANLEALDHACHLIVTAEQRAAGMIGRARV